MDKVDVLSNWISSNGNELNEVITFSTENKNCLIENVTVDTCVCLTKQENDNSNSKPELQIKFKNIVRQLDIFSEGRLVEVFGEHNEYLFTCESDFVDDWEGMAVYHTKIILPGLLLCKLKFTRTRNKTRFWIYSIQITVDEAKSKEFSHPLFNIENINAFLNDSQQISDRAEKFKSLFELFANNSSYPKKLKNQPLNLKSLQKNFQSLSFEKINQFIAPKISSESVEYFKTAPSDKGKDSECFCTCKEVDLNTLEFNKVEHIKWYINEKVNEMKEDILRQIDIKLNEFREENNLNAEKIKRLLDG